MCTESDILQRILYCTMYICFVILRAFPGFIHCVDIKISVLAYQAIGYGGPVVHFSSSCIFIHLYSRFDFHRVVFSSSCIFIELYFHPLVFSSTCILVSIFIELYFHRVVFSSTCILVSILLSRRGPKVGGSVVS